MALCEGDDFWICKNKLQKQVDALEKMNNVDMCFHPAIVKNCTDRKSEYVICRHYSQDIIVPVENIINGGGEYCPTASLMIRKNIIKNLPDWYMSAPVGDYYLQIISSMRGGAIYLNDIMSVYRTGNNNSWTDSIKEKYKMIDFSAKSILALKEANLWSSNNYEKEFMNRIKICTNRINNAIDGKFNNSGSSGNFFGKAIKIIKKINKINIF
ncbi:MAG: hypothetical protein P8Y84_08510 [Desulfuromonadales bacterium]